MAGASPSAGRTRSQAANRPLANVQVTCEFVNGRLTTWQMVRPDPETPTAEASLAAD